MFLSVVDKKKKWSKGHDVTLCSEALNWRSTMQKDTTLKVTGKVF